MKKEGLKERITISIDKEILKKIDKYCSDAKPVPASRSPVIEKIIKEFLEVKK